MRGAVSALRYCDKEFSKQMDDAVAADDASSLHRVPHDLAAAAAAVAVAEAGAGLKSSRTAVRDLSCGSRAHLFWHVLTTSTSIGDEEEVVGSDASVELDVDEDVSDDEVSIDDDVASIDEGEVVGAS